jgi:hypothetical protein
MLFFVSPVPDGIKNNLTGHFRGFGGGMPLSSTGKNAGKTESGLR